MARSGEEYFIMGVSSFEAAREMALASLPAGLAPEEFKRQLFQQLYGQRGQLDTAMVRNGSNDIPLFHEDDARFLKQL